jgi:hypothetical protein
VTDTAAVQTQPESTPDAPVGVAPEGASTAVGTPVAVWIVYVLGILAGAILVASLLFVTFAWTVGGGSGFGVNVSTSALVVWLALGIAAGATFAWRRWGRSR